MEKLTESHGIWRAQKGMNPDLCWFLQEVPQVSQYSGTVMTWHLFCRGRGFCVIVEQCYGVIKTKHCFLLIRHKNMAELLTSAPHNWHVCLVLDVCFLKCESAILSPIQVMVLVLCLAFLPLEWTHPCPIQWLELLINQLRLFSKTWDLVQFLMEKILVLWVSCFLELNAL